MLNFNLHCHIWQYRISSFHRQIFQWCFLPFQSEFLCPGTFRFAQPWIKPLKYRVNNVGVRCFPEQLCSQVFHFIQSILVIRSLMQAFTALMCFLLPSLLLNLFLCFSLSQPCLTIQLACIIEDAVHVAQKKYRPDVSIICIPFKKECNE